MKPDVIIEKIMAKVKSHLQNPSEKLEADLTTENAESVTKCIMEAVMEAALAGFKTDLQENEIRENTIPVNDQKYQFNRTNNKEFFTIFGKTKNRKTFVPKFKRRKFHAAGPCVELNFCKIAFSIEKTRFKHS